MTANFELTINVDLYDALVEVLGAMPETPEPVLVLSAYLHTLAKGFGLSESQRLTESQHERTELPEPAAALINHFLAEGAGSIEGAVLRDRLYFVFVELSVDMRARKALNKNEPLSESGLLKVAQVFWNIEATATRSQLPIPSGQRVTTGGEMKHLDIKVPNSNRDFATMKWTARSNEGATGLGAGQAAKSSGQGFRKQGARLAVLAAQRLIENQNSFHLPVLGGARLDVRAHDRGSPTASIVWPDTERSAVSRVGVATPHSEPAEMPPPTSAAEHDRATILGNYTGVGASHQRRVCDEEIERFWAASDDRRLWLRGGPGLGKSHSARRVMEQALKNAGDDRERLLVWVDSADARSLAQALSSAVDRMPHLGISVIASVPERVNRQARALLEVLANSTWRWLVVLDDADAGSLLEAGLIPTGANPNGRVLITTLERHHHITNNGQVIGVGLFTPDEAEALLRAQLDPRNGRAAPLARASAADTVALAREVGHHPLALSIAAATVVANTLDVADWIDEFRTAQQMDEVADKTDPGGYPRLIGATWAVALDRASRGLPEGVVERAAMVAAVLDPDGHPTWIWGHDTVADWVGGKTTLARRHGQPVAVQRLIDHGIIDLHGVNWKTGRLSIHQLAARAIREAPKGGDVTELAGILASAWVLHLTEDESTARSGLRTNLRQLLALPNLPSPTKVTASALIEYLGQPDPHGLAHAQIQLERMAVYLHHGGLIGQEQMADGFESVGTRQTALEMLSEGRNNFNRAARIYGELAQDQSAGEFSRAGYYKSLGELQDKLGQVSDAQASYARSAENYQRQSARGLDSSEMLPFVIAMGELYEKLGRLDQKRDVFERNSDAIRMVLNEAIDVVPHETGALPIGQYRHGKQLMLLGDNLKDLGWDELAEESFACAMNILRNSGIPRAAAESGRALGRLYIKGSRWDEARNCLEQVLLEDKDDGQALVLLASVLQRLGDSDMALVHLATAAKLHDRREQVPGETQEELTDYIRAMDREYDVDMVSLRLSVLSIQAVDRDRWEDAAKLRGEIVKIRQERAIESPGEDEEELAEEFEYAGVLYMQAKQLEEALDCLKNAWGIRQLIADMNPDDREAQRVLAGTLVLRAGVLSNLSLFDEAVDSYRASLDIHQQLIQQDPSDPGAQRAVAVDLASLGWLYFRLGRLEEAEESLTHAVEVRRLLTDLDEEGNDSQKDLAESLSRLGGCQYQLGLLDEAEISFTISTEISRKIIDLDPENLEAHRNRARGLKFLGILFSRLSRFIQSEHSLTLAVDTLRVLANLDPGDHSAQDDLACGLVLLGMTYQEAGRLEEAVTNYTRASGIYDLLCELAPGMYENFFAQLLNERAKTLRELYRPEEADKDVAKAEELAKRFPDRGSAGAK